MLNFKRLPDEVFDQIFQDAIDVAIKNLFCLGDEYLESFPHVEKYLTWEQTIITLELLRVNYEGANVYSLNGYHSALLYDALYTLCLLRNEDAELDGIPAVERTEIRKIDFNELIKAYFPNLDVLFIEEMVQECFKENKSESSGPIFGKPTYKDLDMKTLRKGEYDFSRENEKGQLFAFSSTIYPDPQYTRVSKDKD